MMKIFILLMMGTLSTLKQFSIMTSLILCILIGSQSSSMFCSLNFGLIDQVGLIMILLSLWILFIMIQIPHSNNLNYLICLLFLTIIISFTVTSPLKFYVFFELSLLPIMLIIMGWGSQPERISASTYMMIYTISASMPFLSFLCFFNDSINSIIQKSQNNIVATTMLSMLLIMIVFMVKLPVYGLHLWLIKAHVEAPVVGSMVLASILLKLGGFGMLRLIKMFKKISYPSMLLTTWALSLAVFASILCAMQMDMKILIAMSSVCHMSLVAASVMDNSTTSINSSVIIMLGHGFSSSALFFMANLIYLRQKSRSFEISSAQTVFAPIFLTWILLCSLNMAAPPSINLLGEMMFVMSIFFSSKPFVLMFILLTFASALYSMILFLNFTQGSTKSAFKYQPITVKENSIIMAHWIPANLLILSQTFIISFS